jgi:hypothetical protein
MTCYQSKGISVDIEIKNFRSGVDQVLLKSLVQLEKAKP